MSIDLTVSSQSRKSAFCFVGVLVCAGILNAASGCSSSAAQAPDGGTVPDAGMPDGGGDSVTPFPHSMCTTSMPGADTGKPCVAGSNLPLCAQDHSNGCADVCLWDESDPAGIQAYCTLSCKPTDPASCPSSFACKQESCSMRNVCVRVSQPGPDADFNCKDPVPSDLGEIVGMAMGDDGIVYAAAFPGASGSARLLAHASNGTWSDIKISGSMYGLTKLNGMVFAQSNNSVLRLSQGMATEEKLSTTCDPVLECPYNQVLALFKTQDGHIRAALHEGRPTVTILERSPDGTWNDVGTLSDVLLGVMKPLSNYGLLTICDSTPETFCSTADGITVQKLPEIMGRSPNNTTSLLGGSRPDDLWAIDFPVLYHFDGTAWGEEPMNSQLDPESSLLSAAANRVAIYNPVENAPALYRFNGKCWTTTANKSMRQDIQTGSVTFDSSGRLLFVDTRNLCTSISTF